MRTALLLVLVLVLAGCCRTGNCIPSRESCRSPVVEDDCPRRLAEATRSLVAAQGTILTQQQTIDQLRSGTGEAAASSPTGNPAFVAAERYRTWISSAGIRAPHIGHWVEALWFPDWQLQANIEPDTWDGPPRLNVWHTEYPHANAQPGLVFIPTGEDPRKFYTGERETVQVPWDLAQRVKATFDLGESLKKRQRSVGTEVEKSGLIREVKEGDSRQ